MTVLLARLSHECICVGYTHKHCYKKTNFKQQRMYFVLLKTWINLIFMK